MKRLLALTLLLVTALCTGAVARPLARVSEDPDEQLLRAVLIGDIAAAKAAFALGANANAVDLSVSGVGRIAPYNRYERSRGGASVLMIAALTGRVPLVQPLIERGADVNQPDQSGYTALMAANGTWGDHTGVVKLLLAHGADPNVQNAFGETALMHAVVQGKREEARLLLDGGANVNARDLGGRTALMLAAAGRYAHIVPADPERKGALPEIVKLLLQRGADCTLSDHDGATASAYAAANGRSAVLAMLLKGTRKADLAGPFGARLLTLAAATHYDSTPTLELLVRQGASVDGRDSSGQTALLVAAWRGPIGHLRFLIAHGADVNGYAWERETALMIAASLGHTDAVRLLLQHGANVDFRDRDGETALVRARRWGNTAMVSLLEKGAHEALRR